VVAAFGLAAAIPGVRPLLDDQRIAGLDRRQLAYQVLLRIPVGTVAWEEIAFRGVLQAALRRVLDEPVATAVGAAVFGLWHIRPTAEALAVNRLAARRGARILAVSAVVAGTAGRARCCPCCGHAPAAWLRRYCCTWPPTARGRWPAPWPDLPTTGRGKALIPAAAVAPDERAQDRGRVTDLAVASQRFELVRLADSPATGSRILPCWFRRRIWNHSSG
jgi:hypothetical protein